jgi:hypothetical protein
VSVWRQLVEEFADVADRPGGVQGAGQVDGGGLGMQAESSSPCWA